MNVFPFVVRQTGITEADIEGTVLALASLSFADMVGPLPPSQRWLAHLRCAHQDGTPSVDDVLAAYERLPASHVLRKEFAPYAQLVSEGYKESCRRGLDPASMTYTHLQSRF